MTKSVPDMGLYDVQRDPQARLDELLAANVRLEQRARDADHAVKALQVTANAANETANRYKAEGAHITNTSRGMADVLNERGQHAGFGFNDKHDDEHRKGEIALAAVAYALDATEKYSRVKNWFAAFVKAIEPWPIAFSRLPRTNLVYAAALLIAEIDRMDRIDAQKVVT